MAPWQRQLLDLDFFSPGSPVVVRACSPIWPAQLGSICCLSPPSTNPSWGEGELNFQSVNLAPPLVSIQFPESACVAPIALSGILQTLDAGVCCLRDASLVATRLSAAEAHEQEPISSAPTTSIRPVFFFFLPTIDRPPHDGSLVFLAVVGIAARSPGSHPVPAGIAQRLANDGVKRESALCAGGRRGPGPRSRSRSRSRP